MIQKLLDDSAIDITRKQSLLQALNDGAPEDEVRQHISQNYYPETQTQFHETIPTASPWMT